MNTPLPRRKRRKLLRFLLGMLGILLGAPAAYLAAAIGLSLIPVNGDYAETEGGVEVYLVSNGIHVDFLVPVQACGVDWSVKIPRKDFGGAADGCDGVLLGWGDRGFYLETPTWADLKVSTALNAVFLPSACVVHAQYVDWRPEGDPSSRRVRLGESAYRDLCAYLEGSFRKDATGSFILLPGKGYGPTDNFYEATGSYHAFNTCNLWTNRGLKRIGVRTALWSPFAGGILRHLPAGG